MSPELIWSDVLAWSLQVGLLVGAGAAIPALFRIRVPRARLLFWQILLAACVALPWVRDWKQEVVADTVQQVRILAEAAPVTDAPGGPLTIPFATLALGAIAAGIAIRLGSLAAGLLRLRAYRRRGWALARELRIPGIPKHVEIMLSNDVSGPVTFGWKAPAILLPASFSSLSPAMREAILCHELAHVERRDWLLILGEELIRAVLWFHPAVWWVIGEIHLAREQAVDESVLETTQAREPYMDALLAMAGVPPAPQVDLTPAPMFLRKRHLKRRLLAIVKEFPGRRISGMRLACLTGAAVITIPAACWVAAGIFPLAAAPRYASDGVGVTVNAAGSHLLHRAPVPYPAEALARGVAGTVVARLQLDSNGEVADAAILSGPQELRRAVLESVLAWHFEKTDAAGPQTVSIRFVKPTTPAAATKIQHIVIQGLPEEAQEALRSKLTVHEGDAWSPAAFQAIDATARNFDSHLQSRIRRDSQGQLVVQIDLYPALQVADDSDVMNVGSGVTAPAIVSKVEPEYSEEARAAKYQGSVLLSVVVGPDGRADDLKVIRSLGMGLDEKAMEAVRKWQFRPGLNAGVPVKVRAQIEVNFRLL
jgi:TonB family protein